MSEPVSNCIQKMRGPSQMEIICIDVTNRCDLFCSNCTRLLANQKQFWDMTPDNFRTSLQSLKNFPGIIAMIGGNPCIHPNYVKLCNIFAEEIPDINKRGIWTNNFFKHQEISKKTFGVLNLNPHNNAKAQKSLAPFKKVSWYHRGHSTHAPVLTALKDLYNEKDMWEKITKCDINQNWSASIIQNQGQLRAYFCEVAASFDLARGEDHGIPVVIDWWKKPLSYYKDQIEYFCPGCGVPAKLKGDYDFKEIDTYTRSNADLAANSVLKGRTVKYLSKENKIRSSNHRVTEYSPTLKITPMKKMHNYIRQITDRFNALKRKT